ncbi:MAG: peptidyl-tRNA hydrolase [Thaumarchaeota archaeon]|nr:peptidyl-tRNA hydrolase [Nitrososphaerota archaeon]
MSEFRFKQVIVVRGDLKMGRGKTAVQVAHAALAAAEEARSRKREWFDRWLQEGQAKIAVKVSSLEELLELKRRAEQKRLPVALIEDRGLTQLPPSTVTCMGIGPAPSDELDPLTGDLKLL